MDSEIQQKLDHDAQTELYLSNQPIRTYMLVNARLKNTLHFHVEDGKSDSSSQMSLDIHNYKLLMQIKELTPDAERQKHILDIKTIRQCD